MAKKKLANSCRNKKSSKATARSTKESTTAGSGRPPPTRLHDIPDKLLELILLHLTSSLWLVRAAATCRRWRRIITHRNFLVGIDRPPHPVAGLYHYFLHPPSYSRPKPKGCRVAFVPSSPSPELPLTSRRFSLDFLPNGGSSRRWEVVDSCGSLLLLAKRNKSGWMRRCFPDLVVCEPVTRRYKVIPRMEEMKYHHCLGVFLLDADHSMAMFNVACVVYQPYFGVSGDVGTVRVCVYREDVWNWSRYMKPNEDFEPPKLFEWHIVTQTKAGSLSIHLHARDSLRFLGHAGGLMFWAIKEDEGSLLVLDDNLSDPYTFHTPAGMRGSDLRAIVDGNGDRCNVRVVILEGNDTLRVVTWLYDIDELILEKNLHLGEATCRLQGYKEGYFRTGGAKVITVNSSSATLTPVEETWMVSVDLETMKVAECKYASVAYPCELPWPPTLRACPVHCRRYGYGHCSDICVC